MEIDGDAPCSYPATTTVELRDYVTLEAVPATGYHFTEWSGEPTVDEYANPIEIDVRGPMAITANFAPDLSEFASEDGTLNILIPEGTTALNGDGESLTSVEFSIAENPLPTQEVSIIGQAYNLEPDGATFDPPATLTWSYDPADIPKGVAEEDLAIAYYDDDADDWVALASEVDPEDTTIMALIDHLTTFAILAPAAPSPPPPVATFTTSSLSISPGEVNPGEAVSISVLLTNTSDIEDSYTVTLKINGAIEETEAVTLPGGARQTVTFTTIQDKAGNYSVDVSGLPGSFTVREAGSTLSTTPPPTPETPSSGIDWSIVAPILTAVFLAIFLPLWLRRRRDHFDW